MAQPKRYQFETETEYLKQLQEPRYLLSELLLALFHQLQKVPGKKFWVNIQLSNHTCVHAQMQILNVRVNNHTIMKDNKKITNTVKPNATVNLIKKKKNSFQTEKRTYGIMLVEKERHYY